MICQNMPNDKYTLPVVDSLKDIGFQFEYSKIRDTITYIKRFIKDNYSVLISKYIFQNAIYDQNGNIIELENNNNLEKVIEYYGEPEKNLENIVARLEKGIVEPDDYYFKVHPIHKNNPEILLKAYLNDLRAQYGAKGNLIYRGKHWGLGLEECIKECLYHRILDEIIISIRNEGKIKPANESDAYKKIKKKLEELNENQGKDSSLISTSNKRTKEKQLESLFQELYSKNKTLEISAGIVILNSFFPGPILSTLDEKKRTIKHYLNLQADAVRKAKDNAKKNKGINSNKRNKVINLFKANQKLSHVEISRNTGVNRKTIAKYIDEFLNE